MVQYALDTNVLLRAAAPTSTHHAAAVEAVKRLLAGGEGLIPLLIPLVGFPAAILMALGRWTATSFVHVIEPGGQSTADSDE